MNFTLMMAALTCVGLLASAIADAHRLRPAVVTLTLDDDAGTWRGEIVLNAEAIVAGISPVHEDTRDAPQAAEYEALRRLGPEALKAAIRATESEYLAGIDMRFDGQRASPVLVGIDVPPVGDPERERLTKLTIAGNIPEGSTAFSWTYSASFGQSALRVRRAGDDTVRTAFLAEGAASEPIPLGQAIERKTTGQVVQEYLSLGFTHIVPKGLDHVLFVLGIWLLSQRWKPLLWQVTSFTLAHTITLALSLYGIVSLPSKVVEPLIALSIVYVAVENLFTRTLKPWRIFVVFAFGLLHGLGFAGVLTALGLPENEYLTALIAFNVGVEFGQLSVILAAFMAVGFWFQGRWWYRRFVTVPASVLIAATGALWTVERIAA